MDLNGDGKSNGLDFALFEEIVPLEINWFSTRESKIAEISKIRTLLLTIVIDLLIMVEGILRLAKLTVVCCSFPSRRYNNVMNAVVVLTPPAIEPGEPPINIRTRWNREAEEVNEVWGIVSKPAVLKVTDSKRAVRIRLLKGIFQSDVL